jgi:hypothetical protein
MFVFNCPTALTIIYGIVSEVNILKKQKNLLAEARSRRSPDEHVAPDAPAALTAPVVPVRQWDIFTRSFKIRKKQQADKQTKNTIQRSLHRFSVC